STTTRSSAAACSAAARRSASASLPSTPATPAPSRSGTCASPEASASTGMRALSATSLRASISTSGSTPRSHRIRSAAFERTSAPASSGSPSPARATSSRPSSRLSRALRARGSSPTTTTRTGAAILAAYDSAARSLLPARHRPQPGRPRGGAGRRLPPHRTRLALAREAGLEGLHQVHHLGWPPLLGRGGDVLALELLLDQLFDALADLVLVLLGMEGLAGDLLDELP